MTDHHVRNVWWLCLSEIQAVIHGHHSQEAQNLLKCLDMDAYKEYCKHDVHFQMELERECAMFISQISCRYQRDYLSENIEALFVEWRKCQGASVVRIANWIIGILQHFERVSSDLSALLRLLYDSNFEDGKLNPVELALCLKCLVEPRYGVTRVLPWNVTMHILAKYQAVVPKAWENMCALPTHECVADSDHFECRRDFLQRFLALVCYTIPKIASSWLDKLTYRQLLGLQDSDVMSFEHLHTSLESGVKKKLMIYVPHNPAAIILGYLHVPIATSEQKTNLRKRLYSSPGNPPDGSSMRVVDKRFLVYHTPVMDFVISGTGELLAAFDIRAVESRPKALKHRQAKRRMIEFEIDDSGKVTMKWK